MKKKLKFGLQRIAQKNSFKRVEAYCNFGAIQTVSVSSFAKQRKNATFSTVQNQGSHYNFLCCTKTVCTTVLY